MPHTSHSRLGNWLFCPYFDKIRYEDGVRLFWGNEHTAFGNAVHSTIEAILLGLITKEQVTEYFKITFKELMDVFPEETRYSIFRDPKKITNAEVKEYKRKHRGKDLREVTRQHQKNVKDMRSKGAALAWWAVEELEKKFPGYEFLFAEKEFCEPITGYTENPWDMKGYIDIGIKHEDKLIVIDWKTCSWGWKAEKRTDKHVTNQLSYYKHFGCVDLGYDAKDIETYFGLIKRTHFKKDKKTGVQTPKPNVIEIFKVSTGPRKIKNALNILNQHVYNVDHKNWIKNRKSCNRCEAYDTVHCPDPRRERARKRKEENQSSNN